MKDVIHKAKTFVLEHKVLFIAAIILLLIKIFQLDQIYLLRGERDITFTGYSLAKTARDLYGNFLPLEFKKLDMPTPFLAFYYSALWWLFIPIKSVFFARLPYVLISLSLLFLVYEFIFLLTQNKKIAVLTSLVFSFSPGVFHLTRLSLEIGLATPLFLAGAILYLKEKRIWSYAAFVLCFFSYNGFRPLIPFALIYLEFALLLMKKNHKGVIRNNIANIVFFIALFAVSLLFIDGHMMASRQKDLVFLSYDKIDPQVIFHRNTAIGPTLIKAIFNNKITSTLFYIITVFVKGQDLQYLFLKGDDAAIYATTFTGQFFLVTMLFYYLGILYLGKKWNMRYFYVLGIIPVALIPSMINIDYISVAIRSMPASIGYAFVIGCGMFFGWEILSQQKAIVKNLALAVFVAGCIVELSFFSYNYYLRRPITMSESFFESEKQIGLYLNNNKNNYHIYDDSPRNIYASYLFMNPQINISEAQKNFETAHPYSFDGFRIDICPSSPNEIVLTKGTIIADSCTDLKLYEKLSENSAVEKIPFRDYSERTAFFILK